ncbi:MAG: branched-chain amino acid ABC transporter permease [Geodermatophilaceae bacterium]
MTGGDNGLSGIPAVEVAGQPLVLVGYVYWYVLVFAVLGFAVIWAVSRSPFGAALRGIRDNEPRMRSLGYSPFRYKLAGFVIAGAVAGLAGGLLAVTTVRSRHACRSRVHHVGLGAARGGCRWGGLAVGAGDRGSSGRPHPGRVRTRPRWPRHAGPGRSSSSWRSTLLRNGIAGLATTRFRRGVRPLARPAPATRPDSGGHRELRISGGLPSKPPGVGARPRG